ncbi:MAG: hypothetical protein LBU65_15055 [Planctomycetaceae bacterium]|jgi:hypothetical protein|nr:hypothetical protein [Planctomycetaceae bacterium]
MKHKLLTIIVLITVCTVFAATPSFAQFAPRYRVAPPPARFGERPLGQRIANALQMFTEGGKELQPFVVASLASYDDFKASVLTMAEKNRAPHGSDIFRLEQVLGVYEAIIATGIDTSQPIGVIVQTDGIRFLPIFFSPIDMKNPRVEGFLKKEMVVQLPDGRRMINPKWFRYPFGDLFMVEKNGWLFVALEEQLASLPDNPTPLLQGLDKEHIIAVKFDFTHLPPLVAGIGIKLNEISQLNKAKTDAERAGIQIQSEFLRTAAQQCDQLLLSLDYDPDGNDLVFSMIEDIKPNTDRDRRRQSRANATSPLHRFYNPGSTVSSMHLFTVLTTLQQRQLRIIVDSTVGKSLTDAIKPALQTDKNVDNNNGRDNNAVTEIVVAEQKIKPEANNDIGDIIDNSSINNADKSITTTDAIEIPNAALTPQQRLELFACGALRLYYETLLATIDNGQVDIAYTFSQEHGLIAAFNVADTRQIAKTLDDHFKKFAANQPESFTKNVQYRYKNWNGFDFTSIRLDLKEIAKTPATEFLSQFGSVFAGQKDIYFLFALSGDTLCMAVGRGELVEQRLMYAIDGMKESQPVPPEFFIYNGYEFGNLLANLGDPTRFALVKAFAASGDPRAIMTGTLLNNSQTSNLSLRVNGMLIPSIWKLGERIRDTLSGETVQPPPKRQPPIRDEIVPVPPKTKTPPRSSLLK